MSLREGSDPLIGDAATELVRVPIAGPSITEREIAYVTEAVSTNWYENAGDFVARFESGFARHLGRRHAVSLPSCTSAIHLALAALGIGPGDEVIVPDATWIASSAPISYVGATPIFADIDRDTWCLSIDSTLALITDRTRAIVAVDLYGGTPDLDGLERLAAEHGVALVEDAAEAIGSCRDTRSAGSFGVASTFSFHGSKTLTTGEGGMLVTDDEALHGRVSMLRDHGRMPGDTSFRNVEIAYKYKMSSLQAALGLAQLERVEELVAQKRTIFNWYAERLGRRGDVTLNHEPDGTRNSYWMVTALFDAAVVPDKHELRRSLAERGIDTRPFFDPLSAIPAYADAVDGARARRENEVARSVCARGLNLPSALSLTEEDVDRVCHDLLDLLDS
jgi:perosamine synthetase